MTTGKFLAAFTLISAVAAGAGLYYTEQFAYYEPVNVSEDPAAIVRLTNLVTEEPEQIIASDIQAISRASSPLGFRACFKTSMSLPLLTETYVLVEDAVPLHGPKSFDCFDAVEIGTALQNDEALAFLGEKNIQDGVDRVIAFFPDGRAFVWHQLNEKYKD